jgi:hypothetical protein
VEITDHFTVVQAELFTPWLWGGQQREPCVFLAFTKYGLKSRMGRGGRIEISLFRRDLKFESDLNKNKEALRNES